MEAKQNLERSPYDNCDGDNNSLFSSASSFSNTGIEDKYTTWVRGSWFPLSLKKTKNTKEFGPNIFFLLLVLFINKITFLFFLKRFIIINKREHFYYLNSFFFFRKNKGDGFKYTIKLR